MVNAVFLVALCFTIFVEAVQRMVEPEGITNPTLLLIVGALGLGINLIGLALFHNQGLYNKSIHSSRLHDDKGILMICCQHDKCVMVIDCS